MLNTMWYNMLCSILNRGNMLTHFCTDSVFSRVTVGEFKVFDTLKMTPATVSNNHVHVIR